MRKFLININCILLVALLCISCEESNIPPLNETFSKKDKNPFGAFVVHQQLGQLYYQNSVNNITKNFETTWRDINDTAAVYINISKNLFLSDADLTAMLAYVYTGNTLFISSERLDKKLLDSLGCTLTRNSSVQFIQDMKFTSVQLAPAAYTDSAAYQYFYLPFYNHFSKTDKTQTVVLGKNKAGPNYLVVFYGRGRFYLHAEPRALSNYFLLQKDNYKYFHQVFSFTPAVPEHVYWDDYYNKRNTASGENDSRSGLSVLLQYPAMAWAFWLLLLLIGLYILFEGKRRQRIVQTIVPNTNTTVAFTETIGRLYLQKKDNRNIADKLITYFMEHIRNQYYLNTSQVNEEFVATLARKANSTQQAADKLFSTIKEVQQSAQISDQQLLSLNQQLENFYKNKA